MDGIIATCDTVKHKILLFGETVLRNAVDIFMAELLFALDHCDVFQDHVCLKWHGYG